MFKKWSIIVGVVATIGISTLLFFFGNMNKVDIQTTNVEDSKVIERLGKEYHVVPASDIRYFFEDNLGFKDDDLFDTYDSEYALVTEDVIEKFIPVFFKFKDEWGMFYRPNQDDCDDFAKTFSRLFSIWWNREFEYKQSPALGFVVYIKNFTDYDQPHAIVIAFTADKDKNMVPIFYEVRSGEEKRVEKIDLQKIEFLSIFGGEMN